MAGNIEEAVETREGGETITAHPAFAQIAAHRVNGHHTAAASTAGFWVMGNGATWMAIIIKRAAKLVPAPEPLVPRPQELEVPAQKAAPEKKPPSSLPVAESQAQMRAHPGEFRAPPPTGCKCCGHLYAFPCHGQNRDCMNKRFADARVV